MARPLARSRQSTNLAFCLIFASSWLELPLQTHQFQVARKGLVDLGQMKVVVAEDVVTPRSLGIASFWPFPWPILVLPEPSKFLQI